MTSPGKRKRDKKRTERILTPGGRLERHAHGDEFLLDAFTTDDLVRWESHGKTTLEFEIRRFHELEALRQINKRALVEALRAVPPVQLKLKRCGRIIDHRYSDNPLSSRGSLLSGGRFNIGNDCDNTSVERFSALYLAENHNTAMLERFGGSTQLKHMDATEHALFTEPSSYTYVRIGGKLERVFDLTDKAVLKGFADIIADFSLPEELLELGKKVGLNPPGVVRSARVLLATLMAQDWRYLPTQYGLPANSQIFASLLREAGFEAIRYRSVRGGRNCIAVFPDMLSGASEVHLTDAAPPTASVTVLNSETWEKLI